MDNEIDCWFPFVCFCLHFYREDHCIVSNFRYFHYFLMVSVKKIFLALLYIMAFNLSFLCHLEGLVLMIFTSLNSIRESPAQKVDKESEVLYVLSKSHAFLYMFLLLFLWILLLTNLLIISLLQYYMRFYAHLLPIYPLTLHTTTSSYNSFSLQSTKWVLLRPVRKPC